MFEVVTSFHSDRLPDDSIKAFSEDAVKDTLSLFAGLGTASLSNTVSAPMPDPPGRDFDDSSFPNLQAKARYHSDDGTLDDEMNSLFDDCISHSSDSESMSEKSASLDTPLSKSVIGPSITSRIDKRAPDDFSHDSPPVTPSLIWKSLEADRNHFHSSLVLTENMRTTASFLERNSGSSSFSDETVSIDEVNADEPTTSPDVHHEIPIVGSKSAVVNDFHDCDSSLSSRELYELDELLDDFEAGKPVDKLRMTDLDVFDRWKNGEELDPLDSFQLERYRQQRRTERAYRREFQELLDRKEKGLMVDGYRLANLSLFARNFIGDTLSEGELVQLERFHEQERADASSGGKDGPFANDEPPPRHREGDKFSEMNKLAVEKLGSSEPLENDGSIVDDDSSLSSEELDELNDLLEAFDEGKAVDQQRMTELDLFDRWKNGEHLDLLEDFQLQMYRQKRKSERAFRREFQVLLEKKQAGKQIDDYRLACLALVARQYIGDSLNAEEAKQLLAFRQREKDRVWMKRAAECEVENHSSSSMAHEWPRQENSDSSLSTGEMDELNDLTVRCKEGKQVDESRLLELNLFNRWQSGAELSAEEKNALQDFKETRRMERRYRKEFDTLLDKRERGDPIDENRFYCLELYARRFVGNALLAEEIAHLTTFVASETGVSASTTRPASSPLQHLAATNQPTALVDQAIQSARSIDDMTAISIETSMSCRQGSSHDHLDCLHQPTTGTENDDSSLASKDLFHANTSSSNSCSIVEAARAAKVKADIAEGAPPHLAGISQPKRGQECDLESIGMDRLFEPNGLRPPVEKALVAAAMRARAQADIAAGTPEHISGVSQPKSVDDRARVSTGVDRLFEGTEDVDHSSKLMVAAGSGLTTSQEIREVTEPFEPPSNDVEVMASTSGKEGDPWEILDQMTNEPDVMRSTTSRPTMTVAEPTLNPSSFFSGIRIALSSAFGSPRLSVENELATEAPTDEAEKHAASKKSVATKLRIHEQDAMHRAADARQPAKSCPSVDVEIQPDKVQGRETNHRGACDGTSLQVPENRGIGLHSPVGRNMADPCLQETQPNADKPNKVPVTNFDIKLLGAHSSLLDDTDSDSVSTVGGVHNADTPQQGHKSAKPQKKSDSSFDNSGSSARAFAPLTIMVGDESVKRSVEKPSLYQDSDTDGYTVCEQISPIPERCVGGVFEVSRNTLEKQKYTPTQSETTDSLGSSKSCISSDRKEIVGFLTNSRTVVSMTEDESVEIQVAEPVGWTHGSDNEELSEEELDRRETAHNIAVLQMQEEADYRKREAARQMELTVKRLHEAETGKANPIIYVDSQVTQTDEDSDSDETSEGEHERRETAHAIAVLQMQEEANFRKREVVRRMELAEKQREADAEEARRSAIQADQRRLDEVRRKQEEMESQEQKRHITDNDSDSEEISEDEHERRETAHAIAVLQMQEEANFRKREVVRRMELAEKQREADAEEARRSAIQADQRRLDEVRRKQEEMESQEQKRLILLRLEAEEKRFKDEAEDRLKEEERLLDEAQKALDRARLEASRDSDVGERREQIEQIRQHQQPICEEEEANQMTVQRPTEEKLLQITNPKTKTEQAAVINLQNEKARKKNEENERKKAAAQQALAAQGMAMQLMKQREERLQREQEEKERQEQARLERERLEREASERQAELARKRDRIQELQRLKRIAQERERKLQEEQRERELAALSLVPKPMEDPSSSSSQSTVSFAPPDSSRHEAPDSPSKGSYTFATVTSTRRYAAKKQSTAATMERLRGHVEANRQLKIRVRPLLSWRSDPSESFSDWKVIVRHQGTRQVDEYHVHRNIIGYGPRKSGFFAQEFLEFDQSVKQAHYQQQHQRNRPEPASQLTLPSGLADVVSFTLDYLYLTEGDTQPTLTAEKACRVYKLAERLEMPTLQTTVAEFYRQHIKASNMGMFLRVATLHDASKLTFIAKAQIGSLVTEDPTCARLLKPTFLGQLADILAQHRATIRLSVISKNKTLSNFEKIERLHSKRWSRAIVYCSQAAGNVFDPDLLEKLTSDDALPVVDGTASLGLLRLYETVTGGRGRLRDSLDRRCALGLMEDWILVERQFASRKLLLTELHTLLPFELEQQVLGYVASRYG